MSKANCCITGSSWSFHFAERSSHCLCYITEGMTEKLYRVLLDTGDMTSLQRPLAIEEATTGLHDHRHYIFGMGKACQSLIIDLSKKTLV